MQGGADRGDWGALELKRSIVAVAEGIRQNLDNQKKEFIQPFFSTMQWLMAGNDTEGLRYAPIQTPEKYWLQWVEPDDEFAAEPNLLDRHLLQVCNKARFLELVRDFIVYDAGTKKLCRQNQYFGVQAAQVFIRRREGGIIWHTQGSGKSLTMVWLAKWIRENRTGGRVLIITDRTELDQQIETVFKGVNENIVRTKSGADLIEPLNKTEDSLLCSLVHKFGGKEDESKEAETGTKAFIESLSRLPPGFAAKGDIHVFVDECHRTQSGDLHKAMKALLPNALFIGFTGTPLLKADKQKAVLLNWHRQQLRELIPPLLNRWQSRLGVEVAAWGIKKMKTKWGSCNRSARRIWLNLELAKKPERCLEYIVVHELAHLRHRHHDDEFTVLMDQYLPNWRQTRTELNAAPLGSEKWPR